MNDYIYTCINCGDDTSKSPNLGWCLTCRPEQAKEKKELPVLRCACGAKAEIKDGWFGSRCMACHCGW